MAGQGAPCTQWHSWQPQIVRFVQLKSTLTSNGLLMPNRILHVPEPWFTLPVGSDSVKVGQNEFTAFLIHAFRVDSGVGVYLFEALVWAPEFGFTCFWGLICQWCYVGGTLGAV
jgi:hypothetical protein